MPLNIISPLTNEFIDKKIHILVNNEDTNVIKHRQVSSSRSGVFIGNFDC